LPGDNIAGAIIGRLTGIKYIGGGVRTTRIVRHKFIPLRIVQNYLQNYVIFNSEKAKEIFCKKGYNMQKAVVIKNAIEASNPWFQRNNNTMVKILMVGRFNWKKDYETGIKAVSYLYNSLGCTNIIFQIAGYGELENEIRSNLKKYAIEPIAEIFIKPDNLDHLYKNADIYFSS
jgi:glycosyltransferase involved in cell wall biosynthesis